MRNIPPAGCAFHVWGRLWIALPGDWGRVSERRASFLHERPGPASLLPHYLLSSPGGLPASILWDVARVLLREECSRGDKLARCAEGPLWELPGSPEGSLCRQLPPASPIEPSLALSAGLRCA